MSQLVPLLYNNLDIYRAPNNLLKYSYLIKSLIKNTYDKRDMK